ncbi:MAG: helix-turn-helix domain-containing protein, partial [Calditrichia bacterium]
FMRQRNWVGNIRELENFVERLVTVISKASMVISADCFPADLLEELDHFRAEHSSPSPGKSLRKQVQKFEAHIIRETLISCNWNQSQAARKLQTSEKNIRYKMQVLNIRKPALE